MEQVGFARNRTKGNEAGRRWSLGDGTCGRRAVRDGVHTRTKAVAQCSRTKI